MVALTRCSAKRRKNGRARAIYVDEGEGETGGEREDGLSSATPDRAVVHNKGDAGVGCLPLSTRRHLLLGW